jgi:HSP20 family protein
MAEKETKLPVKKESATPLSYPGFLDWHPFETLRRQIDRLFEEFPSRKSLVDFEPFERFAGAFPGTLAVDFVEKDKEYGRCQFNANCSPTLASIASGAGV